MKIVKHRLCKDDGTPYPFVASPNKGGKIQHKYLVMHFTAGRSFNSSVSWLTNPQAKASAHLVIGRDGRITQLVAFDTVAWHAGVSSWKGLNGLNTHSIGIEMDNAGQLKREGGKWRAWFKDVYPDDQVLEAVHKNEPPGAKPSGWHIYTPEQIDAAVEVASVLVDHYGLLDVLGHDDIAPGRKTDPGPAFPMTNFRAKVLGRVEEDEAADVWETTEELNIRTGPGAHNPTVQGSPLPKGAKVEVLEKHDQWRKVQALGIVNNVMDLDGWVHGRYLKHVN